VSGQVKVIDADDLERWRMAGEILARINPDGLRALLVGAEVMIAGTPEPEPECSEAA
jgi:hypothetical protein